jgi:uncharacterized membrane protein AbrB (regulator of aidB expression)
MQQIQGIRVVLIVILILLFYIGSMKLKHNMGSSSALTFASVYFQDKVVTINILACDLYGTSCLTINTSHLSIPIVVSLMCDF